MKRSITLWALIFLLGFSIASRAADTLEYGQFSVSLKVKNIQKSYDFYSTLGFKKVMGDLAQKWIILSNTSAVIGLFEENEGNILTFNPKDVRSLHKALKAKGIKFDKEPVGVAGPGYAMLRDLDGNVILLDQH